MAFMHHYTRDCGHPVSSIRAKAIVLKEPCIKCQVIELDRIEAIELEISIMKEERHGLR